jgi:hypothetical protein
VVKFMLLPLYPRGKTSWYPLDRMLVGIQNLSVRHGEMKILDITGLELQPLGRLARSQSLYENETLKSKNTVYFNY